MTVKIQNGRELVIKRQNSATRTPGFDPVCILQDRSLGFENHMIERISPPCADPSQPPVKTYTPGTQDLRFERRRNRHRRVLRAVGPPPA